jgi:hypothetical protein
MTDYCWGELAGNSSLCVIAGLDAPGFVLFVILSLLPSVMPSHVSDIVFMTVIAAGNGIFYISLASALIFVRRYRLMMALIIATIVIGPLVVAFMLTGGAGGF